MMHKLEIFRYALFPSGASYSDVDFKKRVFDSIFEIKVLLGEGCKSVHYSIDYEYSNDKDYFWLVAFATNSAQRSLHLFSEQETMIEFAQRIQERVTSLPIVLNSIALEIDALRYNGNPSVIEDKPLVSLVLKQSGKNRKIKQNGQVQEFLFPECDPFKLEQEPRLIRCKIHSLTKYEAILYEIEDPESFIRKYTKVPLVFGGADFNQKVFNRLADCLYLSRELQLKVHARIGILEGDVEDYHFHSVTI